MAKWGEGDPRWIVEERPDAKNVNNWHWTEKNATPWSEERLRNLFKELKFEQNDIQCKIDEIDKCKGEAAVNNRKGKLIFIYEWDLVLSWSGFFTCNKNEVHKGNISIPNLSEENELNDIEITVTIEKSNEKSEALKLFMYNVGRDEIRNRLGLYIKELREEYSKNLILPKKGEENSVVVPEVKKPMQSVKLSNIPTFNRDEAKDRSVGSKIDVKSLKMTKNFQCSASDLYNALTKPEMLTAFTGTPAKIDAVKGGKFVLFGGNIEGSFEELIPEQKIVQTWRLKSWPSGYYSKVVIEIEETDTDAILYLNQTGIPFTEVDGMENNWERYYWDSIKRTFLFGSSL